MIEIPYRKPMGTWEKIAGLTTGTLVLDVGCGHGDVARLLKGPHRKIIGIEINHDRARAASQWCDVVLADATSESVCLRPKSFDTIIFADVLEHLPDPLRTLQSFKRFLKDEGNVVISVPNIAFYSVRKELLLGRFDLRDSGIMDRTHLHFFTQKTFRDLLESAGLKILVWEFTGSFPLIGRGRDMPGFRSLVRWIEEAVVETVVRRRPTLMAGQFIVRCRSRGVGEMD